MDFTGLLRGIHLDKDVLVYFRATSRPYQTQINAVPKAYVNAKTKAG